MIKASHLRHELRRQRFALLHRQETRRFRRMRRRMKVDGYSLVPCDQHRCIFVRVPKCATQSIARSLFGNLGGGHLTIDEYRLVYSAREFHDFYKFAVVRNPWDRLVSAYFFLRKGGVNDYDKNWFDENLSGYDDFEAFVEQWLTEERADSGLHFRPQHRFVCLPNGKIGVDYIAYYERIEQDYEVIARHIGAAPTLKHVNASANRGRDYRDYYTSRMRDIVADVYARDIALFGYRFDAPRASADITSQ